MAQRCFQGLAQGDHFLMDGAVARWLAAACHCFLVSMNSVFLDLSRSDLGDAQVPEERDQVNARPPVLAFYISLVALPLGDDVVVVQVMCRDFAKGLFAFDFSGAKFSALLQVPVLGDFLGFREAFFLGADAPVLAREIGGGLPQAAIGTLVDVDLAAEDGVLFGHRHLLYMQNVESV